MLKLKRKDLFSNAVTPRFQVEAPWVIIDGRLIKELTLHRINTAPPVEGRIISK